MVKETIKLYKPRQSDKALLRECREAITRGEVAPSSQRELYDISPSQVYSSREKQNYSPRRILSTVVDYLTKPIFN